MNSSRSVSEDVVNLKKKPRTVQQAKEEAKKAAIQGFNPFQSLFKGHIEAKKKALAVFKHEMKQANDEVNKVTLSTNYISGDAFVMPNSGYLVIGVHVYMAGKKGFLQRLASGSMGNWFTLGKNLGVKALQIYVKGFAGESFAKQVTGDSVFNAVGEGSNEGKVSYFVMLKVPRAGSEQ